MSSTERSLRLLRSEVILSAMVISMPIMNPFYYSIGMDQGQIGLSQAIFTIALLMLNVPTGWIADRFSLRYCNAAGDLIVAIGFCGYAAAQSFAHVIVGEIVIGIGLALTNGADRALLKAYCLQLKRPYAKEHATLQMWRPAAEAAGVIFGGVIGAESPRLAIALTAVPFAIGSLCSFQLDEIGDKYVATHRNPFRDMTMVVHDSVMKDHRLRWLILAHAVGREITHPIIWVLTPFLLLSGIPASFIGVGWAVNLALAHFGARCARRFALRMREWQRFLAPMAVTLLAMSVLSLRVTLGTIWLYGILGFTRGWMGSVTEPMIQEHAPANRQAMVISVAGSVSYILYIPLVWGVNAVGIIDLRLTMVAMIIVFTPLVLLVSRKLYLFERS